MARCWDRDGAEHEAGAAGCLYDFDVPAERGW